MLLITGATGAVGSHVVRALLERGAPVRVFARDPDRARALFGRDVDVAVGDFAEPATIRAALDGVDRVFLSCADHPLRVGWERAAVDAAVDAGVSRVVKLSAIGAAPGAEVAFWDWHGQVEEHLRAAPVPSVVLRSGPFMSNVLMGLSDGVLAAPAGDAPIAMVHPADVGGAAASALLDPGHDGCTYVLTGGETITYEDAAAELSVPYVPAPDAVAQEVLVGAGLPAFVAAQVVALFGQLRAGAAGYVTDAVEVLTGAPPRSFAQWAAELEPMVAR